MTEESDRAELTIMFLIDGGAKLNFAGIGVDDEFLVGVWVVEDFFGDDSCDLEIGFFGFVGPWEWPILGRLGEL